MGMGKYVRTCCRKRLAEAGWKCTGLDIPRSVRMHDRGCHCVECILDQCTNF